jgi:hypothetical protein
MFVTVSAGVMLPPGAPDRHRLELSIRSIASM